MNSLDALAKINKWGVDTFRTVDIALLVDQKMAAASKLLDRLSRHGHLVKLRRDLWTLPKTDPISVAEHLTAPYLSYVSLLTALYYHGIISQIPNTIFIVSTDRAKRITTPLGIFSIHHLPPDFLFGFKEYETSGIRMAEPEKALLDTFYLRSTRSNLFSHLPELDLSGLDSKKCFQWAKKIQSKRKKEQVLSRLHSLFETS